MICNGRALLEAAPIKDMIPAKKTVNGVSYGLSEVGYDIRLKQDIRFIPANYHFNGDQVRRARISILDSDMGYPTSSHDNFCLGSSIEEFDMPQDLCAIVHDKSTWARQGLSVFNTVIEPGWKGFLTLELVFHGNSDLHIPAGSGIAQVIFHRIEVPAAYEGKYQNQEDRPVPSKFE